MFDKFRSVRGKRIIFGVALILICVPVIFISSCNDKSKETATFTSNSKQYRAAQNELQQLLKKNDLSAETRYAVVNRIANNMLSIKDYNSLILFLTDWEIG